jgi:putative transposase
LLDVSWSPCRRSHPAGGHRRAGQRATGPAAFAQFPTARPPGFFRFGATAAFTLVAARGLAHPPPEGFVDGLQSVGLPLPCHPSYGAAGSCPGGTAPAEHVSITLDTRELQKLGLEISQAAVSKYLGRRSTPPSQTWRTFLDNHLGNLVSVDFFVVPTVLCKVLFAFVVLAHERRRVLHINVTDAPTAQWTAQQLVKAFPWETAPRYVLRDRDAVYGVAFSRRAQSMEIHELKTAPRSPWQNPYVERLIGTLRRECLDHVVVLNEAHLRRLLREYLIYYHGARTHPPWTRTHRSPDRWSTPTRAASSRYPWSEACIIGTRARRRKTVRPAGGYRPRGSRRSAGPRGFSLFLRLASVAPQGVSSEPRPNYLDERPAAGPPNTGMG